MTFPLKLHLLKKEKSLKSIKGTIHTICIWREESWKIMHREANLKKLGLGKNSLSTKYFKMFISKIFASLKSNSM